MPRSLRAAAALATALLAFVPAVARADTSSTVTVVGTSDVSDSGLVAGVLKPGFEAAYPQYTLNYMPSGTGQAIANAESGVGSALIVHAASLENAFVGSGYSNEQYGRAVFWGDYVLLGPTGDPAHVLDGSTHDIVTAFEKIATLAAGGNANFIARGGPIPPGTGVEEHLIWAKTNGVATCTVTDANGGGTRPSTVGGTCAASGTNDPAWYHETGSGQAPTVLAANTCNFTGGNCYVLTDRGTFQFLQSQGNAQNLKIVTRDNDANARGGQNFMVNSFHAYVVKPSSVPANANINVPGATAFLNWMTSPAGQAAISAYLNAGADPPFHGSASPSLSGTALPATVTAGTPVTVTGNIHNVVPGTPALASQPITLGTPAGTVASGTTDAAGNYSITFTPAANGAFTVGTGQISEIVDSTLNPIYGDLLTPASTSVGSLTVQSTIKVGAIKASYRRATVSGTVAPGTHANGVVTISARKSNSGGAFVNYGKATITGSTYSVEIKLPPGKWAIQARFDDNGQVLSSVAPTQSVTVPGASSVKVSHATASGRNVKVTGSVSPAPSSSGAYVKLLARKGGKGSFRAIGKKVTIAKGKRSYTIKAKVGSRARYQFEVEYVHKGAIDTSKSKSKSISIK